MDIPPKIICNVDSGVFNSGESKNYFHFRVPPTPAREVIPLKKFFYINSGVNNKYIFQKWSLFSSTKNSCDISITTFSIYVISKMTSVLV